MLSSIKGIDFVLPSSCAGKSFFVSGNVAKVSFQIFSCKRFYSIHKFYCVVEVYIQCEPRLLRRTRFDVQRYILWLMYVVDVYATTTHYFCVLFMVYTFDIQRFLLAFFFCTIYEDINTMIRCVAIYDDIIRWVIFNDTKEN